MPDAVGDAELEDVAQHLRDGDVERGRDFGADVDVAVEHARERRRFEDRHVVLGGDFADAGGDQVDALGDDDRRAHALVVVRSATAKCVGFVTMTSAFGTSCIMRWRAICCCSWRMRPFTSGEPSLSLCPRGFPRAHLQLLARTARADTARRSPAMSSRPAEIDEQRLAAQLDGVADRLRHRLAAERQQLGASFHSTMTATTATTPNFASAFSSSISCASRTCA